MAREKRRFFLDFLTTKDKFFYLLLIGGIIDAFYLTYEHYAKVVPPCSLGLFNDCGRVLQSQYALILGVPVALLGFIYYVVLTFLFSMRLAKKKIGYSYFLFFQSQVGLIFSLYLLYLQFFIIKSICIYCLLSALISILIYFFLRWRWWADYQSYVISIQKNIYQIFLRNLFFLIEAERIHEVVLRLGEMVSGFPIIRRILGKAYRFSPASLQQEIAGITFSSPVGLAAGFDYQGRLVEILPFLSFGFVTVGTITNRPYAGNSPPRLGRLPQSKSLLVNKGFKNEGAETIINRLLEKKFSLPVGISIGQTNTHLFTNITEAIEDICSAFRKFEMSKLQHVYYELNISCPNLKSKISFYSKQDLNMLLQNLNKLKIRRPVFIKMPIEKTDQEFKLILDVIASYTFIKGVIIGNLQKNRLDPAFVPAEVARCGAGNFSGKPTWQRSNELIAFTYRFYNKRFIIIGCGGIFSASDAYIKIRLGANLVQLVTGLIYEGPQLVSEINHGLDILLRKDGFCHLSQVVGVDVQL